MIFYKDGAKMMRPIHTRKEYLQLRNSGEQQQLVQRIRNGEETLKHKLLQMNYSCLPNEDGTLKGSTRMSTTVGMDIDHLKADEMPAVRDRILAKKDELGLKMMEESARGCGYHLVFARKPELSQEENLKWASNLISVAYDSGAKDITRVFFTTSGNELIYLDDAIFELEEVLGTDYTDLHGLSKSSDDNPCQKEKIRVNPCNPCQEKDYNGMAFGEIIDKYWELFNGGKVPTEGDRNALTFELAVTIRSICGYNLEQLMQVIPNYWAAPDGSCTQADMDEYRKTIENALKEPRKGMPYRLKQVLQALKSQAGIKACGGTPTTPPNARKFFYKMVNDGTVGRLDVATIIRNDDDDDEPPVQGIYDEQFAAELKPYIDRLEAASGLIECPQAKKLSLDIRLENKEAAKLFESEAYRVLSYRANVISWLKGMLLYVAHGYRWDKTIADFVRWSEQYNLWCKMLYFGDQLEKELREEVEIQRRSGPKNLLRFLPDEFNREQYMLMRQQQGR